MAIIDLIGRGQIESQRKLADRAAIERFDRNDLNPQLEEARQQAEEGIVDDPVRQQVLERLLSRGTQPSVLERLSTGRALATQQQEQSNRMDAISDAESQISLKEEQAQREGRGRVANVMAKMNQVESQRQAKLKENRLMAEAEANRRRNKLTSSLGKVAGMAAGAVLGPTGASLGGALGGALAGGLTGGSAGMGAVAGGVSGMSSAMSREMMEGTQATNEQSDATKAALGKPTGAQEPMSVLPEQEIESGFVDNLTERAKNIATQTQEGRASMQRQTIADFLGMSPNEYKSLQQAGYIR